LSATSTIRINLWSGPRNISTALMYSFAQRADTIVLDEPLYGWYLQQTGADHPGREEIIQAMNCDGRQVLDHILYGDYERPVLLAKQMTHHLLDLPKEWLLQGKNILLVRHPAKVLHSYSKVIAQPELEDIGIRQSWELYQYLQQHQAHVFVVDGDAILKNPMVELTKLCQQCEIPFDDAMLHWKAGARKEDGIWAKYWYSKVHQSTGFEPYMEQAIQLPPHLDAIAKEAEAYYHELLNK
jgi:hypothetical protein